MEGNIYIQGYRNDLARFGPGDGNLYAQNISSKSVLKNTIKDETGELYTVENIPYYSFAEVYKTFEF